jgi:trehalose 6-phosphate phosphatase
MAHQPVPWASALMDEVHDALVERVASIEGASVEHNKFCVSVHYRRCPERWPEVEAAIEEVIAERERLHITRGRKVYEVRPNVEWDKGQALLFLLRKLGLDGGGAAVDAAGTQPGVCSLYLGDDVSDEDAFRALADRGLGIGILVASRAKPTAARYTLSSPEEVQDFLWRLVSVGEKRAAGMQAAPDRCNGGPGGAGSGGPLQQL